MCKAILALTAARMTHVAPPAVGRLWLAAVSVDASQCAADAGGHFEIVISRLKENAPEVEFRERFAWAAPSVSIGTPESTARAARTVPATHADQFGGSRGAVRRDGPAAVTLARVLQDVQTSCPGEGPMAGLPIFQVLNRSEQPPDSDDHILLVHRFSTDRRSLVHDISAHIKTSKGPLHSMTGPDAFTGSPGEALRRADELAVEYGAAAVYVRDDT
jgi:hypothetical protein